MEQAQESVTQNTGTLKTSFADALMNMDVDSSPKEVTPDPHDANDAPEDVALQESQEGLSEDAGSDSMPDGQKETKPRRTAKHRISELSGKVKEEAQAREAAEKEAAQYREQLDNLQKTVEMLVSNDGSASQNNFNADDFLRNKGVDPDNILDDATKDLLVQTMLQQEKQGQQLQHSSDQLTQMQINQQLNSKMSALPPEIQKEATAAINYLKAAEAQRLKFSAQSMGKSLTDAQANQIVEQDYLNALQSVAKQGHDPVDWSYQYAQTLGYKPNDLQNGKKDVNIDLEKVAETQERAGKPAIETAAVKFKGSKSFDDLYRDNPKLKAFKFK